MASVVALLLMTRSLPAADVGTLVAVQSFALIAGLAITLNLEAAALRVLPGAEERAPGTSAAYFLLARRTVMFGLPLTLLATLGWFIFQVNLTGLALFFAVLTVPCGAALRFGSFAARGLGEVRRSSFYSLTLRPALFAAGLALLVFFTQVTLTTAMIALLMGFAIAAGLQIFGLLRLMPKEHPPRPDAEMADWRRTGLILMVSFLLAEGFSNTAILISSAVLPEDQLARLAVTLRVAFLVNMAPAAIMMALSPQLAKHLNLGHGTEAEALARRMTWLGTAVVAVGVLLVALLSGVLLSLFGSEYADDRALLLTLLIIPVVSALTGPAMPALTVKGEHKILFRLALANLFWLLFLVAAASQYGVGAVAVAIVIAHASWRGSVYLAARSATGLNPILPLSRPVR